jgi:hypothetical protein
MASLELTGATTPTTLSIRYVIEKKKRNKKL